MKSSVYLCCRKCNFEGAVQVVKSFYAFVVENEGSVLRCESTN